MDKLPLSSPNILPQSLPFSHLLSVKALRAAAPGEIEPSNPASTIKSLEYPVSKLSHQPWLHPFLPCDLPVSGFSTGVPASCPVEWGVCPAFLLVQVGRAVQLQRGECFVTVKREAADGPGDFSY